MILFLICDIIFWSFCYIHIVTWKQPLHGIRNPLSNLPSADSQHCQCQHMTATVYRKILKISLMLQKKVDSRVVVNPKLPSRMQNMREAKAMQRQGREQHWRRMDEIAGDAEEQFYTFWHHPRPHWQPPPAFRPPVRLVRTTAVFKYHLSFLLCHHHAGYLECWLIWWLLIALTEARSNLHCRQVLCFVRKPLQYTALGMGCTFAVVTGTTQPSTIWLVIMQVAIGEGFANGNQPADSKVEIAYWAMIWRQAYTHSSDPCELSQRIWHRCCTINIDHLLLLRSSS